MPYERFRLRHPTFQRIFGRAEKFVGLHLRWKAALRDLRAVNAVQQSSPNKK
jgi:hypothetical protein